jgi:flagellar assembly protein FliH
VGNRIDIGELYRKRLFLNHSSGSEVSANRKRQLASVSQAEDVAEAIQLSTAQSQAQRILRDAVKEARLLLKNARKKADSLQDAGRKRAEAEKIAASEKGYSSGYMDGMAKAESEFADKFNKVNELLDNLSKDRNHIAANLSSEIADLVILITGKVVGVLTEDKSRVIRENIIAAAKESFKGSEAITVRLAPDEFELLSSEIDSICKEADCRISFVCDSSLLIGDCRILSPSGGIAFSFEQRFSIMEDELRRLLQEAPFS